MRLVDSDGRSRKERRSRNQERSEILFRRGWYVLEGREEMEMEQESDHKLIAAESKSVRSETQTGGKCEATPQGQRGESALTGMRQQRAVGSVQHAAAVAPAVSGWWLTGSVVWLGTETGLLLGPGRAGVHFPGANKAKRKLDMESGSRNGADL